MTFLERLLQAWLPSSSVDVRALPNGHVEARVRYSDKDWVLHADAATKQTERMARELIPRRPKHRRLHWGAKH